MRPTVYFCQISLSIMLLTTMLLAGCSRERNALETVQHRGKLVVATRNSPTTFYEGASGPQGLEYDLARAFAEHLHVELELNIQDSLEGVYRQIMEGRADLAAAALSTSNHHNHQLRFGDSYQEVAQQLVYRINVNKIKPRSIKDIIGSDIDVAADSAHANTLKQYQKDYPDLKWHEHEDMQSDALLELVWSQYADYTVADSNDVKLNQRFMPDLAVAFDLGKPQHLAWAYSATSDPSLSNSADEFFTQIKASGKLKQLINKYYGHVRSFNYVGTQIYLRDIAQVLPIYTPTFKEAALEHGLDWRLLAAIGYQESHWNPDAVSPTGVRGIMMLTKATAKFLKIENRRDPIQSIEGGAEYFRYMLDKIPKRITEPDRTWMALAAYNVGYGHLEDARKLTVKLGNDPDRWVDVREALPLLSQPKWYKQTKHGYARGREPVGYVANIRNYYEILSWKDKSGAESKPKQLPVTEFSPTL